MAAAGQTVEDVPAARLARDLATQLRLSAPRPAGGGQPILDGEPDPAALPLAALPG